MVQKYKSPVRVYKHPFEIVMRAYEKRFPTCKLIPVFLGSDILSEFKSEDNAIHIVERKCKLNVDAPYLLKKIANVEYVYFIQKNALDYRSRTLKIDAHNESFSSRVIINEHCSYSVHPENPDWTCFEQDASLDIKSFFGFESTVEKIAMKQYVANIKKGKDVMEHFISEVLSSGIKHIPKWVDPNETPLTKAALESTSKDQTMQDAESKHDRSNSDLSNTLQLGATAADFHELTLEDDSTPRLEAEYIERFLGTLTPLEESRLMQLRTCLSETYKEKIPKDAHILRFLRARDFHLEKAREMLCHSLAFRKQNNIDNLLNTYNEPEVVKNFFSGGWHYQDKEGRPVFIVKLGQLDVKGLMKAVGEEALIRHILAVEEEGLKKMEEATKKLGHAVGSCTCIVDLEGLSMRHLWRPGIKAFLRLIEVVEANYPETMGRLLIVRAPRVFPVLWTVISPFIDENTRKKFMIYAANDYQGSGGLVDFIDSKYIPDFLGGDCYCDINDGGMVPKNLYMYDEEQLSEHPKIFGTSVYQTAYIEKGFPHEVLVQVPQRGCVITWDFDILKSNVTFSLMRCIRPLAPSWTPHEHHLHGPSSEVASIQYIDKNMTVGVDLSRVESPHVCRDGDSVQGSHVTRHAGTYILQWRHYEHPSSHTFDFLSHKAKIMFYTELLKSDDFKGSMSSLQSSQSGFSSNTAMSGVTGQSCPSR